MIEVYNKQEYLPNERFVIQDNEAIFPGLLNIDEFTDDDYFVIKAIDNAKLIDTSTETIETKFGTTNIRQLSTGCKTVLNYLAITRHLNYWEVPPVLEVTECGANALDVLFGMAEKYPVGIIFLLRHTDKLFLCSDRNFKFNGKVEGRKLNDIRLYN